MTGTLTGTIQRSHVLAEGTQLGKKKKRVTILKKKRYLFRSHLIVYGIFFFFFNQIILPSRLRNWAQWVQKSFKQGVRRLVGGQAGWARPCLFRGIRAHLQNLW